MNVTEQQLFPFLERLFSLNICFVEAYLLDLILHKYLENRQDLRYWHVFADIYQSAVI